MRNQHVYIALLVLAGICGQSACGVGTMTTPDGLGRRYAGEWTGTTTEGTAIAFAVSEGNIVTSITIGRDIGGCREPLAFSSLSLAIGESDRPGRVPIPSNPGFGFGSGSPEGRNFVQVLGRFPSTQAAQGTVTFLNFEKCENTVALWNATKR